MNTSRIPTILAAVLVAASFVFVGVGYSAQTQALQNQTAVIHTLSGDSEALREQVYSSGDTPVAPAPDTRTDGADGSDGARGKVGPQGVAGLDGADGADGAAGIVGESITGPVGTAGPQGASGASGADGSSGADGLSGTSGSDGAPGQDGADGAAGAPGGNGEPPASWTFTDAQGDTYTCTRAELFDAENPQYKCTTPTEGITP